jgi:hypothetical protein
LGQFWLEQKVVGSACPDEDGHFAELGATPHGFDDHRPERSETEATSHYDEVLMECAGKGETIAEWPANAKAITNLELGEGTCDATHSANRMDQSRGLGWISTDRDGYFAQPWQVEHVELPRPKGEWALEVEFEREGVTGLLHAPSDARDVRVEVECSGVHGTPPW